MKRSNLTNLVVDAIRHGDASASGRNWQAHYTDGTVAVYHFSTHMIDVARDGTVTPVNPGWGSTTDRCGIRRITAGYNGPNGSVGYRELFEEVA
jgi:hypothetical protein